MGTGSFWACPLAPREGMQLGECQSGTSLKCVSSRVGTPLPWVWGFYFVAYLLLCHLMFAPIEYEAHTCRRVYRIEQEKWGKMKKGVFFFFFPFLSLLVSPLDALGPLWKCPYLGTLCHAGGWGSCLSCLSWCFRTRLTRTCWCRLGQSRLRGLKLWRVAHVTHK